MAIRTEYLQPDTLWETHFGLLEDQEAAYRNYLTVKEVFGAESKITKAALAVHEAFGLLRAAMLEQLNLYVEREVYDDANEQKTTAPDRS